MTLGDLLEQIGEDEVELQIVRSGWDDWDAYDKVYNYSELLKPFEGRKIKDLTAMGMNVFRFAFKEEKANDA